MIKKDILEYFKGKKTLVTGGTGLIGRQVVDILCGAGAKVTIVSLDRVNVHASAEHVLGDITDFSFCRQLTHGVDLVFHLAGIKGSIEVSRTKLASHFVPTLMMNTNMLEAARVNNVAKLVYTSSIGAYANAEVFKEADYRLDSLPMDFAGWAKRVAELQVHAYCVQYRMENFAVVRPCNVYGPGDNFDPENAMVIPSLMCRIHRGENPVKIWGDGSAIRDFAYSRDVAEGVILALYHGTKGSFVNLGSGTGHSIKELVEALHSFIGFNYEFDTTKPSGAPIRVMDVSLAKETIGYHPTTSLRDGLKLTWEWFLSHQDEYRMKKNYFVEGKNGN
ncbi:MAG TPA: NAD-dependent epimerase/dehydratase family protein [Nitrospirota bacterium]|nr:NAD-dependent epimerase/dehydratase family protein [Nitrospirota bacterium]